MMKPAMNLPVLKVTVFSDYICPFCYIGSHRLQRLRDNYDLKINWRFLEIHPEISAEGEPIDSLEYPSGQWQQMIANLKRVAGEENIPVSDISFITSSKDALLLSEAAKQCGREIFYDLHGKLFHAYFVDGRNIGDKNILRDIATDCGVESNIIESAWREDIYNQTLLENYNIARQCEVQSVPSFLFGDRKLTGVVNESVFRDVAQEMTITVS
jgi:predicted DsbA family dithiol-disulfide isomerase